MDGTVQLLSNRLPGPQFIVGFLLPARSEGCTTTDWYGMDDYYTNCVGLDIKQTYIHPTSSAAIQAKPNALKK